MTATANSISRGAALLLTTLLLLVAAALGCGAIRQHDHAAALAIRSPDGVEEAMFVAARGSEFQVPFFVFNSEFDTVQQRRLRKATSNTSRRLPKPSSC